MKGYRRNAPEILRFRSTKSLPTVLVYMYMPQLPVIHLFTIGVKIFHLERLSAIARISDVVSQLLGAFLPFSDPL